MFRSQFRPVENAKLYALIERDPWILNTPPVPPGLRLATTVPAQHSDGVPPVVFRP
jgi:hypothetical protein